jgi:ATP-binding cassette subfamily F protein uup
MHLLSLENVSKAFPENPVLTNISVGIGAGERIGIIGRNGSGKSTLLALIAGDIQPDSGGVVRARGLRVARLDQDPQFNSSDTIESVLGSDRSAISLVHRLGLADVGALCSSLSGGQRKRLALAIALAAECDLLILDEPTNHLDVDSIDWLEDHLQGRREALLLVTHDRFLLDRVANRVLEVHDESLYSHQGTYQDYLEAVATRDALETATAHRLQQRIKTELAWLRRSPKARTTKSRARIDRAHDLMARRTRDSRKDLTIDLPTRRLGSKVVDLHNAGKRYGDHWVIRHVEYKLHSDARIGVVGPNGAGKTTLLSLMAGRLQPDEGKVSTGTTVHVGWYGQDPRPISPTVRLHDAVREHQADVLLDGGVRVSGAQLLERFLFSREQQQAQVGELSGGERRRLELLLSLMEAPNLLFLDEPTNDLDIDTLSVLEEYLDVWDGALVVASHDRYFLERTCADIFSIESDASVRHHPGGWIAYRDSTLAAATTVESITATTTRSANRARRLTYNDQRELDGLTRDIPKLEAERDRLSRQLTEASQDVARVIDLSRALTEAIAAVDEAETRWLELTEHADTLAAD